MDAPVKAGDIIDGRYRLERIIGTGGMAVVVAAIDVEISERVALKFLFRKAARHKEILQRFEREKAVIARLQGEHVAKILDSGVVKNTPYMVMEYLQGSDLSDVLRVQKTLPLEHATEYVLQACEAVAEAHGLEIVHRDLKPGNLFLTHRADGSPCIKVFDFGIAKILAGGDEGEGSLTRTEVVMGSPFYMSPEQMISAKEVGPATDIWAMGVILYQLLSGKLPFAAKTVEKVCARVLNDSPTPLREVMPGCPDGLDEVLLGCFQRMPEERYADIGAFASALAPFAPEHARALVPRIEHRLRHPGQEPPVSAAAAEVAKARDPEAAPEAPTVYLPRKSKKSWKGALFVAFGLGMAGLGFAGGMYFRGNPPPPSEPDPSEAPKETASAASLPTKPPEREEPDEPEEPLVPDLPIEIDLDEEIRRAAAEERARERAERRREAAARAAASAEAEPATPKPAGSATVPTPKSSATPSPVPPKPSATSTKKPSATATSTPTGTQPSPPPTSTSTGKPAGEGTSEPSAPAPTTKPEPAPTSAPAPAASP